MAIFSLALTGLITVISQGNLNINNSKLRLTATYLANEGLELIRSTRDNSVLEHLSMVTSYSSGADAEHAGWNAFHDGIMAHCTVSCDIDAELSNPAASDPSSISTPSDPSSFFPQLAHIVTCAGSVTYSGSSVTVCPLYYETNPSVETKGYYNDRYSGSSAPYYRSITVTSLGDDEIKITSTVYFRSGSVISSVSASENMFNWYN